MKKVRMDFPCPACESQTEGEFLKPTIFGQAFLTIECAVCGSTFNAKVKQKRGQKDAATFSVQLESLSKKGREIQRQKAEFKNA